MSLAELVRSDAKILEISQYLDSLSHDERLAECQSLSGNDQKLLFRKAADSPPLDFEFYVPAGTPPLTQVIHHGKNSQPAFRNCTQCGGTGVREVINTGSARSNTGNNRGRGRGSSNAGVIQCPTCKHIGKWRTVSFR